MDPKAQIQFYFPEQIGEDIRTDITNALKDAGMIDYVGFAKREYFEMVLTGMIPEMDAGRYKPLSSAEKEKLTARITDMFEKSFTVLEHPTPPVLVYVFPWFPQEHHEAFEGVNALVPFKQVLHLFVAPDMEIGESLERTVSHEYNHLVYYHYHPKEVYTLYENMIMEGLAEVFREEVVGGKRAAWADALSQEEALSVFETLKPHLESIDRAVVDDVLFGSDTYTRWTGYSIGYWLVRLFRQKNPDLSWKEIVQQDPEVYKSI